MDSFVLRPVRHEVAQTKQKRNYFAVRFTCREREDHAIICQSCFYKNDCPDHREGLAVDHGDYEANEDTQAWP